MSETAVTWVSSTESDNGGGVATFYVDHAKYTIELSSVKTCETIQKMLIAAERKGMADGISIMRKIVNSATR